METQDQSIRKTPSQEKNYNPLERNGENCYNQSQLHEYAQSFYITHTLFLILKLENTKRNLTRAPKLKVFLAETI